MGLTASCQGDSLTGRICIRRETVPCHVTPQTNFLSEALASASPDSGMGLLAYSHSVFPFAMPVPISSVASSRANRPVQGATCHKTVDNTFVEVYSGSLEVMH